MTCATTSPRVSATATLWWSTYADTATMPRRGPQGLVMQEIAGLRLGIVTGFEEREDLVRRAGSDPGRADEGVESATRVPQLMGIRGGCGR